MSRKNQTFNEVLVGLFVLAVFAVLVFFTIVISGVNVLKGRSDKTYTICFDAVGNLSMHDNVTVRGMPVGTVKKLTLQTNGVAVLVQVAKGVRICETYSVHIASSSLLGGSFLTIDEGTGAVVHEGTILTGTSPIDWMRELSETVGEFKKLIGDEELAVNLKQSMQSLSTIMTRVERGEGTLGKLLGSDDAVYRDLSNTVASLKSVAGRLERGEGTLGKLVSDDGAVYDSLKSSLANVETIAERLAQGKGTAGKLLSEDDSLYVDLAETVASAKEITARLNAGEGTLGKLMSANDGVYSNLVAITESLKNVSTRLEAGEGTLGKLAVDETLYTDITGLVGDMRQVLDNFRETQPLTTFGSLILGGL